jgi:three-Cys-motif partner protein
MGSFHEKPFDESTLIKLEIFRKYLGTWVSIFMRMNLIKIGIYDFFSGPGYDAKGQPGTPVIIVDEVRKACCYKKPNMPENDICIVFNDVIKKHIEKLKENISRISCNRKCCKIEYYNLDFKQVLNDKLSDIKKSNTANLIIMDQFGIKDVTLETVKLLSECPRTDIMFFFPSSFVNRFKNLPEVKKYIDLTSHDYSSDYNYIHRQICLFFRRKLGRKDYFLAPFSIKKKSAIYGVIFGSNSLLGIEKFLEVCWKLDPESGEANFNINNSFSYNQDVFPSMEDGKVFSFEKDLMKFIENHNPDNRELYKYCIENGIITTKVNPILKRLQDSNEITVWDIENNQPARKNAFYLSYDNYSKRPPKVKFNKGESHGHKQD